MTPTPEDTLTTIEAALVATWSRLAMAHAAIVMQTASITTDADQAGAIDRLIVEIIDSTVRGMRDPRAVAPLAAEVDSTLRGIALSVLQKVLSPVEPELLH
jgi:hypothetical protein